MPPTKGTSQALVSNIALLLLSCYSDDMMQPSVSGVDNCCVCVELDVKRLAYVMRRQSGKFVIDLKGEEPGGGGRGRGGKMKTENYVWSCRVALIEL